MKKLNKILLLLIVFGTVFLTNTKGVDAASFSVSTSATSVSAGGTATITIKASDCGGQFSISASGGAKVSSSSLWVESGSSSVTVTAPSSGSFSVTVTASDVANSAGTALVTGSKSVSMSVKSASTSSSSSSSTSSSTTTAVVDTRSSDNALSKLSVDKGTLSPEFSASTMSYSVSVKDQEEITISATAKDSKASVSGAGKKELKSGENSFSIIVTAENGTKKTYTINVSVKYSPTVFFEIGEISLGVVNQPESAKIPSDFEESVTTIGENEVKSWVDSNSGIEIVCLIDEDDVESLYVVEEGEIISTFVTMAILGKNVYILEVPENEQERTGLVFQEVEVDGNSLMGWSFERDELSEYALVRVVLKNGDVEEYLYSSKSNTMIYIDYEAFMNTEEIEETKKENEDLVKVNSTLTNNNGDLTGDLNNMKIILGVVSLFSVISLVTSIVRGRRFKKDYLSLIEEYGVDEDFLDTEEMDIPMNDEISDAKEQFTEQTWDEEANVELVNEEIVDEVVVESISEVENYKLDLSDFDVTDDKTEI